MLLLDFPSVVKKYAPYFESCFSVDGFTHFKKAVSGFMISENKTLEGINRLFVNNTRHQASFNKFFNRQNFDISEIHAARISMLQDNTATAFKFGKGQGVVSLDNSLLKHYGKCFDNIYYHYDYVHKCYRWAHDLVTLYYSDDQTDYPIDYQLWEPPDWEKVALFFMERGYPINQQKWDNRKREPQKWRNYIRSRYRCGRKKFPEVVDIYKTKLHLGEALLTKYCDQYPNGDFPVALDSGFTSAELCQVITQKLHKDYVGALREDQTIFVKGEKILLKELVQAIRQDHAGAKEKFTVQKTSFYYREKKQTAYTYFANCKINGFEKKQRLVISFLKEDLSDRPNFSITNRLDWYPSGILRIRRHRWPVETYHQEGKVEGLEKYQVRNEKAIQTYIALVVVAFSMLKCTVYDDDLLSKIQQRLQTQTDGTLPFLRRLFKAEGLLNLVEYILDQIHLGKPIQQIFEPLAKRIAYT
jgi:hypothetical protein